MASQPSRGVYEPVTALTDFGLGAQGLTYAVLLRRSAAADDHAAQCWVVALGAAGVAALAGGIHHTFFPDDAPGLRQASWRVVGLATGLAGASMLAAGVYAGLHPHRRPWWLAATAAKSFVFGSLNLIGNDFRLIIADYATSMLAVLALLLKNRAARHGRRAIVAGILVSFIAAAVQMTGFRRHKPFNHNDAYHVVQALALHLLYTGAHQAQSARSREL